MSAVLEVKWNGKRFPIEFQDAKELMQTTVRELKGCCQRITGAEPSLMKLNAFGALMNNDDMPLSTYGLFPGCFVILKLEKQQQQQQQQEKKTQNHLSSNEVALLEQLNKIQSKLDTEIQPQVKQYEKDVKEFMNQTVKTDKDKKKHVYMGAYLSEQLMHVLFDLDGFICGSDNVNARQVRKETVKSAQTLLDKVDEIKSVVKNVAIIE